MLEAQLKRMADSVNVSSLPPGMDAYLGYVDGAWPDFDAIRQAHPGVPVYGLTVYGVPYRGSGVDAEWGDATVGQAAACVHADISAGIDRPIGYCPQSWASQLVQAVTALGHPRAHWRLLTAHYAGEHICGAVCGCPVEADGTQWVDHGLWDESLLSDAFITAAPHPAPPTPAPLPPLPPQSHITMEGQPVTVIPIQATLDPTGWTAVGVPMPTGKTKNDVVSIMADAGSGYDGQGWHMAEVQVDFEDRVNAGGTLAVFHGEPNAFYTARVFVAD